jgi:hypothetical protein
LPISNETAKPDKRDSSAGDPILLQRGSSTPRDLLNVMIGKQWVEH